MLPPSSDAQSRFDAALDALNERRVHDSLAALADAERLGFDPDSCCAARWDCWMLLGHFHKAWAESDAISRRGQPDVHRFWDGQPFDGKSVMLRCLHGLGDAIQFIRYAPLIRRVAARLTVETHASLVRLFRTAPGVDEVITWGPDAPPVPPDFDSEIEINELPRIFASTVDTLPSETPYLFPAYAARTHEGALQRPLKVGLNWSASEWNPARSLPGDQLTQALRGSPCEFRSVQFGPGRELFPPMRDLDGDILDLACDMGRLDLIVTVDTMAAHLAGALAKPVWVLLPFEADWRWMLDRCDSPWYPTMRLFRQPRPGDWNTVLGKVREALESARATDQETTAAG